MKIKFLALAAMAALSVGSAQAAAETKTLNWGTLIPADTKTGQPTFNNQFTVLSGDTYDNFYTFSLGTTYTLKATAVANNSDDNESVLSNNTVILAKENTDKSFTNIDKFTFVDKSQTYNFGILASGDYRYEITGKSTGTDDGLGNISTRVIAVSAVPEAETYAMLLAGLGLMGFMSRRRKCA